MLGVFTAVSQVRPARSGAVNTPPADPQVRNRRAPRRKLLRWSLGALAVVIIGAGAFVWWFFRGDAPDAVSIGNAVAQVQDSQAEYTGVDGTWSVDTSVGEFSYEDSTGTFVGLRVEEELSRIGSTTAVGRTPDVTGTLEIEGTSVTSVSIEADMTAITTNESRRDDKVQSALDTAGFPTATFVLTKPIDLGSADAEGGAVSTTATGELTIHGVTKTVTIPIEAQLVDDNVVVVGSLDVVFADYGVSVPSAPIVVSAEDHGVIELQLFFTRA
jgi:polyisoprenoid-binding protein YceI